jgi:8-amino-7-oxononanoate synthase
LNPKYLDLLTKRNEMGSQRSLSLFSDHIDFYSNDYLGLSKLSLNELPSSYGSTGSRLLSGNSIEAIETETYISDFFGSEKALIFNSGYDANVGFFSSVPQKGEYILYDEYIHASIRDGIRLSNATSFSFKHNRIDDLEKKIKNLKGTLFVVVESIYSMHGDFAPLEELFQLSEKYQIKIIIDEAHSVGISGINGKGLSFNHRTNPALFARIITFSKAYGAVGGAVLGKNKLIEFLINFSRSFIYTTALPPFLYKRIKHSIELSLNLPELNQQLLNNIKLFQNLRNKKINNFSPIQTLVIGDLDLTIEISKVLQSKKIAVKPILPPTVKSGEERIRICMHSFNTTEEIHELNQIIHACCNQN